MASETLPDEEDTRETRKMDPELLVMGRMVRLLDELDEGAQSRVVEWLRERYRENAAKKFRDVVEAATRH